MTVTAVISAGLVGILVVSLSTAALAGGAPADPNVVSYASTTYPPPHQSQASALTIPLTPSLATRSPWPTRGRSSSVIVTMSIWACESGPYWDNCQTTNPEATFTVPTTLKIYETQS